MKVHKLGGVDGKYMVSKCGKLKDKNPALFTVDKEKVTCKLCAWWLKR